MPKTVNKTKGLASKRFAEGGDVPKDEVLEEIKKTEWYKEFTEEYGEPPDLETSDYDYRKAWKAGVRPERDPYDKNKYHWASSDPATGDMLKAEDHPTAWKEHYMRETGKNPDEVGVTKEQYEQSKEKKMAKGGVVKNQMNNMLAEGGVMQEGGTVDPVSGNDVPPGAMAEEVRDDIDAKLSEGEFVIPADVVRYIGLEKLMMMRDKAKAGLKRMSDIGQMGNAEEVEDAEALHSEEDEMDDETFSSEIDSIIGEEDKQEYSAGGDVRKYAPGGYVGGEVNKELYRDAPLKGFEMVAMTNDAGQTIYIPFINGKPQLAIPQGYRVKTSDLTTTTPTPTTGTGTPTSQPTDGGADGGGDNGSTPSGPNVSMTPEGPVANTVSPTMGSVVGAVLGFVTGLPTALTANLGKAAVNQMNFQAEQAAMFSSVAQADTSNEANLEGVTTAAATPTAPGGPQGTGGAAASAAASAAAAAAAAGMSAAAQGAAAQAAADAVVSGLSPSQAAEQGNAAAVSVGIGEANAAAAEAAPSVAADVGGSAATSGPAAPGGGEAPSVGDTGAGPGASDGSGPGAGAGTGGASPGDSGDGGTGAASSAGDGGAGAGAGAGGAGAGDGGASAGDGSGWAKGGFVSKRKKTVKTSKQKGLAARR